jgi:flavodoxin
MKPLVVYFSHSGNNRLLAEHLATRLACDSCPVIEKRRRSMITIFMDMMFNRRPAIEPIACKLADYDRIILVAPIWGSKVANPMKSLIEQQQASLPGYAFISLCGHGTPEQEATITQELTTLTGHRPLAIAELRIRELLPDALKEDVKAITRYRATLEDLATFEPRIDHFMQTLKRGI